MTIPIYLYLTHIFLFTYHLMGISKLFKDISSILSKGINHFVQGYQPCALISKPWLGQFVNTNLHLATIYCKLWPNSLYLCIPSLWAYAPHHFVIFKDISKFLRGAGTLHSSCISSILPNEQGKGLFSPFLPTFCERTPSSWGQSLLLGTLGSSSHPKLPEGLLQVAPPWQSGWRL